jgi:uncharacterized protein with gpF-like domain
MPSQRSQQAAFERRHSFWEKRYSRQFFSYLKATYNQIASKIAKGEAWEVDTAGAFKIYRKLYQTVSIDEGRRSYNENVKPYLPGKKDMIDDLVAILSNGRDDNTIVSLWRQLLNEFIDTRITGRITNISSTTERKITKIIEDALLRGEGSDVIARTIRREAGGAFNQNRSVSIARTETMTAQNQGRYLAALSSPFEQEKKWSPVLDSRTRDGHANMYDDPFIDFKDEFFVRNSKGFLEVAQYPGDERLSAGNIINCRCSMMIRPKRGENGRLIRKL